jgi:D-alanyl-D-alanine carboxypeptidase (penicillin-binding protein 5/6)
MRMVCETMSLLNAPIRKGVAMTAARLRFAVALAVVLVTAAMPAAHAASIETIARQAILMDITSGTVLLDKGADQRMPPSSMSKIMTMYMVFQALKNGRLTLDSMLPVTERAWRMQGSKMFVELHNSIKVDDLIRGVIIESGNDACIVLAEGLGGSEQAFAELMNTQARALGLKDSNFANATGWPDPNHYMSARDLALLAEHLIRDFPQHYHYYSQREFVYHGIKQGNRNPLLYRNIGVDGLKTGHTDAAGYGLTASAERDGRRLVLVVNGLPSMQTRADESARLIEWGFREFNTYPLFKAGDTIEQIPVWLGAQSTLPVTVADDLKVTMARTERTGMKVSLVASSPLAAPIHKGDSVGKLVITAPGFVTREVPVVASQDIDRLGFFGRVAAGAKYAVFGAGS